MASSHDISISIFVNYTISIAEGVDAGVAEKNIVHKVVRSPPVEMGASGGAVTYPKKVTFI